MGFHTARFSPDGKLVLTIDGQTGRIWEISNGHQVSVLKGHDDLILDAAFSPDGKLAVTAGQRGKLVLWEVGTGKMAFELYDGRSSVVSASFFT